MYIEGCLWKPLDSESTFLYLVVIILLHLAKSIPCTPAAIIWQLAAPLCALVFIYLREIALEINYCKPTIIPDYREPVINHKWHRIILFEHLYQVHFWCRSETEQKVCWNVFVVGKAGCAIRGRAKAELLCRHLCGGGDSWYNGCLQIYKRETSFILMKRIAEKGPSRSPRRLKIQE